MEGRQLSLFPVLKWPSSRTLEPPQPQLHYRKNDKELYNDWTCINWYLQECKLTCSSPHDKSANEEGPRPEDLDSYRYDNLVGTEDPVFLTYLGCSNPFHSRGTMDMSAYMALPKNRAAQQARAAGRNLKGQLCCINMFSTFALANSRACPSYLQPLQRPVRKSSVVVKISRSFPCWVCNQ